MQRYTAPMQDPSLWQIFIVFFRIGLFTFGGGFAMLSVMRHELTQRRKWIAENDFWDVVTVATSFPGVVAVNTAFSQGLKMRGARGAIAAVLGVLLPSFFVILLIARFAGEYLGYPVVADFLSGAAAGVTAVLAHTLLHFFHQIRRDPFSLVVAGLAVAVLFVFHWHPLALLAAVFALRFVLPFRRAASAQEEKDDYAD